MTFVPRLSPVVRGACHAVTGSVPLPESPPAPATDAPVAEVLAEQAEALAATVEEASPEALRAARAAARARAVDEALIGTAEILARGPTLTHRGYGPEPKADDILERSRIAGLRAAGCAGGAARLRPYLGDGYRAVEVRERYVALLAAEAEWKARAERERHPERG
ncbi:hypothetical protein GCM10007886_32460 [Methylobacterium gregans]|jgi:hypothetical protein|uniref:Uncharacterized protein n=1 Tax=Methylobacterium gregans TaxID=374424 RepID=A0AA37HTQ3_9HYPH|nr:hypothetical protein [Methylobacterium gregans]MDQ0522319.1 hypothetical protein [Methylobacterium gregans]GJD81461.1 hypothetical protein NBEOAGPD_4710 [Methylobacterium gregans]GLS55062.1 hypothetical protein GCM10007886_32460 [Methylobacterium gregans]